MSNLFPEPINNSYVLTDEEDCQVKKFCSSELFINHTTNMIRNIYKISYMLVKGDYLEEYVHYKAHRLMFCTSRDQVIIQ